MKKYNVNLSEVLADYEAEFRERLSVELNEMFNRQFSALKARIIGETMEKLKLTIEPLIFVSDNKPSIRIIIE